MADLEPACETITVFLEASYGWTMVFSHDGRGSGASKHKLKHHLYRRVNMKDFSAAVNEKVNAEIQVKTKSLQPASWEIVSISAKEKSSTGGRASAIAIKKLMSTVLSKTGEVCEERVIINRTFETGAGDQVAAWIPTFEMPGIHFPMELVHSARPNFPPSNECIQVEVTLRIRKAPSPPHSGPIKGGVYTIRSCHSSFIRGHPGGEGAKVDMQTRVDVWERWSLVPIPGTSKYGIRSAHGTYMRAHPGGEGAKVDLQVGRRDWSQMPWEQFTIVRAEEGKFGILSTHGTYLRAHPGNEGARLDLQVDKTTWKMMPWEQFTFLRESDPNVDTNDDAGPNFLDELFGPDSA